MTPEEAEVGKVIAGWLATVAAAAVAAWRVRGRRERSAPRFAGPPDDQARKVSRKEWHDIADRVQAYEWKVGLLAKDDQRIDADLAGLREEFDRHIKVDVAAFTRLEERFTSHVKRWEEVGKRAEQDRDEMLRRLDRLNDKLDQRSA